MIDAGLVDASRLQFAVTALFHFIFVPLTLGLSFILVAMELTYVMSGKQIYKDMTKFWGKLFGINFALGVTTGITMEFQFGTNWAYYSHYVGDIFGAPLAIEGLMAFFLESTMIGLFFFGWKRLSKVQHLVVTVLLAHRMLAELDPFTTTMQPSARLAARATSMICGGVSRPPAPPLTGPPGWR